MNNSNYGWKDATPPHSFIRNCKCINKIQSKLRPDKILDIDSGNSVIANYLTRYGGRVVGIDVDPIGVEISKINFPNVSFHNLSVYDDPKYLVDIYGKFDLFVSVEVISHLYNPKALIDFASMVLSPKGALIVCTPYYGYLKNLLISILNRWGLHHSLSWLGGYCKFFEKKSLKALIEDCGFEVSATYNIGRIPFLWNAFVMVATPRN